MNVNYFQKGFNYSQDGPGNRLVIHMHGCNLKCPWCSNPEGIFGISKKAYAQQIFDEILSCKRLFIDGGGVTFSGGECTLQKESLKFLLEKCKEHGINTAIETNGTFEMPESFYPLIDLIICDFKHYDENKLQNITGMRANYKKNVAEYIKSGRKVLIRTVLINGFNAEKNDATKFIEFFINLPCENVEFEFLPYHEYGKIKWISLGKDYKIENGFISNQTLKYFEDIYKQHGLNVVRY